MNDTDVRDIHDLAAALLGHANTLLVVGAEDYGLAVFEVDPVRLILAHEIERAVGR